jgi:peptidoglycan hydrolase CwlO-like protein
MKFLVAILAGLIWVYGFQVGNRSADQRIRQLKDEFKCVNSEVSDLADALSDCDKELVQTKRALAREKYRHTI